MKLRKFGIVLIITAISLAGGRMARPRRIDKALAAKARLVVARATEVEQLRAAQAVLLPALASATLGDPWGRSGHSSTTAAALAPIGTVQGKAVPMGTSAQGAAERPARSGVFGPVG